MRLGDKRTPTTVRSCHSAACRSAEQLAARLPALLTVFTLLALAPVPAAYAGGGGENVLLIINPESPSSLYLGNYYKNARNIPDANVIYYKSEVNSYANFADRSIDALFGALQHRGIDDHVDFVVIPPGEGFSVFSPGLIGASGCTPVTRLSITSAYGLAFYKSLILGGTLNVMEPNQFYSNNPVARAFRNSLSYAGGVPSTAPAAKRYYIGFMLGNDGFNGNTLDETIAMIDRSVAADGTRPGGTFYFMKTTDTIRSNPRDPLFPAVINEIIANGGQAVQIDNQDLPTGQHDCLGILTGAATPNIDGTAMTITPGAFCDHLTSYAATFEDTSQVKLSRWIAKGFPANGASASMGTVEEPCVFGAGIPGKFPHPRLHSWYYQGVCAGEALFRSIQWAPFQCLFYGDPLTQPFAWIPTVTVPDAPGGAVSGTITLTPNSAATRPGATIANNELFVDGRLLGSVTAGGQFSLNTTSLADGHHDLRVVARETGLIATVGRWIGTLQTNNFGRSAALSANPPSGNRSTLFTVNVSASGGTVTEIRLLHNSRVIAATQSASAAFSILGDVFGGGPVRLVAEAEFSDGKRALSAPVNLNITFSNPPIGAMPNHAPVAYSYTRDVTTFGAFLIELPASDEEDRITTYNVLSGPAQSTVISSVGGPGLLLRRSSTSAGTDTFQFSVSDGQATSNTATITLRYSGVAPDTAAPSPNPMQFLAAPTGISASEISMQAVLATDTTPPIQYYFDYVSGAGGHDSGWQLSRDYIDTGLPANSSFNYRIRARDSVTPTPNTGNFSSNFTAATHIETPTGVTIGTVTANSVQLTAAGSFTNVGFLQTGFFFEVFPPHGSGGNVWISSPSVTVTGLSPCTAYTFRVRARNFQAVETPFSPATMQATGGCPTCALSGDVNGDAARNGLDIAGFIRVKLGLALLGDNAACADYSTGTLAGDIAAFTNDLLGP